MDDNNSGWMDASGNTYTYTLECPTPATSLVCPAIVLVTAAAAAALQASRVVPTSVTEKIYLG